MITTNTLLLIEGDDYIREQLARVIRRWGHRLFIAANAQEGVKLYKEKKPKAVFLDILLPDSQGPEVLKEIKKINPQATIYCLVDSSNVSWDLYVRQLGAKVCLTKLILLKDALEYLEKFPQGSECLYPRESINRELS